jgi:hypothetical protein
VCEPCKLHGLPWPVRAASYSRNRSCAGGDHATRAPRQRRRCWCVGFRRRGWWMGLSCWQRPCAPCSALAVASARRREADDLERLAASTVQASTVQARAARDHHTIPSLVHGPQVVAVLMNWRLGQTYGRDHTPPVSRPHSRPHVAVQPLCCTLRPLVAIPRPRLSREGMNNQQQAVARFEQICDNCQVPTTLVEDHAAGDLVCSVRGLITTIARIRVGCARDGLNTRRAVRRNAGWCSRHAPWMRARSGGPSATT